MNKEHFDACERKHNGQSDLTWQQLAELFDIPSGKILKDRYYRVKNKNKYKSNPIEYTETEIPEYKETIEIKEDGTQISQKLIWMFEEDSKSKEFVLNAHGYDPDEWELVNAISNIWQMPTKNAGKQTLFQSKITVKPKVESGLKLSDIDNFLKNINVSNFSKPSSIRQYKQGGLILEIDLADVHISNESLPHDKLKERIVDVIEEVKRRTLGLQLEEIKLVQLGDIFHFDNYQRQTTSGTQVTSVGSYPQMFDEGVELMIWVIDELSNITKIKMENIFGNHDKVTSYALAKTLEAYYKNNNNVRIDVTHNVIKFLEMGVNSVALVHGDMPKANIYDTFTKEEGREIFGRTKYSEIHCGHVHHEISLEKHGVITRWLPSITVPDEWHIQNGYRGAKQGIQCFLWDKKNGLDSIWMINCK